MNFTIQKDNLKHDAKFIATLILLVVIISLTVSYANAITTLYFNGQSSTLELDLSTSPSQSFFVNVPNEYVLSASMDMEGIPVSSPAAPANRSDVIIVTDVSGSMDGDKLDNAIIAGKSFVDAVNTNYTNMGLVKYAGCPSYTSDLLGLTNNSNLLRNTIQGYSQLGGSNSGTNIGRGLKIAIKALDGSTVPRKYILLLTDGQANRYDTASVNCTSAGGNGNAGSPAAEQYVRDMAVSAAQDDIVIFTIGLGGDAAGDLLNEVAVTTGGKYFYAPSPSDLEEIYRLIAQSIATPVYPTPKLTTTLPDRTEIGWGTNDSLSGSITWLDNICGLTGADCRDFTFFIQSALDSCSTDICKIYFNISSNTSGKVMLSNFKINTIQNGNCGKPSCIALLESQGFTIQNFKQAGCTDGIVEVDDPFVFRYVHNMYAKLQEIRYDVSSFNIIQPSSGNYTIIPIVGERNTRYKISGINVSHNDSGLGIIQVVLPRIPDRPLKYCPIIIKKSPYNPIESQNINTDLLVTSSRTATGYNSGDFKSQGPYIFTVKVWLRK